jgi:nucleotide-binding universal stress UspA family protein
MSLPLLRWASLFACEQGAALRLVHAIPGAKAPAGYDMEGARFRAALHDLARHELADLQKEAGTSFEAVVQGGDVGDVVRKTAQDTNADLVVIGRGTMSKLFGRMRTQVYSIIRDAPCPVISV